MADMSNSLSGGGSASNASEMNIVAVSNEDSSIMSGGSEMSVNENSLKIKTVTSATISEPLRNLSSASLMESENIVAGSLSLTSFQRADSDSDFDEIDSQQKRLQRNEDTINSDLVTDSDITWLEPSDSWSYHSGSEESDDIISCDAAMTMRMRAESSDQIYLKDDVKEVSNLLHGYTLVEEPEDDGFGLKIIRNFYPRICKKIRTYKKKLPMTILYNKLSPDETGVVEEEDVVDEEMDVDEITETILVKTINEEGVEIEKQVELKSTYIHDPTKHRKFLKLPMVNDRGQVVDELIEMTDDPKRTQDILRAAAPYMKKKKDKTVSGLTSSQELGASEVSLNKVTSLAYLDWMKSQNSQHSEVLHRAIINLKRALDDRKMLKQMNKYLGRKLCQYYDLKGKKDPKFKYNKNFEDGEEEKAPYQRMLLDFGDVVHYIFSENKVREKWITSASNGLKKDSDELSKARQKFYEMEEAMVRDAKPDVHEGQSNRTMSLQEIINRQKLMDNNLAKARFECINSELILKELKAKEATYQKSIDELQQVDFINYESMRAKTKDLNDKLDLKEKQIMNMKDTMIQRVQALAHVRLKKESLTTENEKLKEEKNRIELELQELRKENIKVHQERRMLEKQLDNILVKEGLEKYPYLMREEPIVAAKDEDQRLLLTELVSRCSEMKSIIQMKLDERQDGVERYREIKAKMLPKRKYVSCDIK